MQIVSNARRYNYWKKKGKYIWLYLNIDNYFDLIVEYNFP